MRFRQCASTSLIPQLLPAFNEKHPGVCINFFEYGHSIQDKLISDTNLDFAILSNWQEHPKLNYELLCHEEILLVLPVGHPLAQKAVTKKECRYPWLDLSLFADTPFILHFPDQNTGRSAQRLFDQYGIQPPVPYRTRNNQTCIQLASQNLGDNHCLRGICAICCSILACGSILCRESHSTK